ncbi:MAG: glycosyltransferase family 1 protein [Pedosphaera sp.]|nr:glycosyltransferase family 1 protein [Pedosphaera sp.]
MKIVHVETGRHLYGGALQVVYLLRGLRKQYPNVQSVLVCPPGSAIAHAAQDCAHRIVPMPMSGDLDVGFVFRLKRVLQQERPNILHLHSRRGADIWGGIAGRLCNIPTLLTRRVDNSEARSWVAVKYRMYDHIAAISNGIRDVLLNQGLGPGKVTCVHSATDTDHYHPGGDRAWLNEEFGLPSGNVVVGIIAQLIDRKGHRFLFDALPDLVKSHPKLRVLICGKGPIETQLRSQVARLSLDESVIFAGFRSDMDRILPCLDLVVHPALIEGLGVSLLQAAACEVPIIASNAGGIPEVVQHEHNGLLVPSGNSKALQRAMDRLIVDGDLRRRMGKNGRALVREQFSIAQMTAGNHRIYQGLMAESAS